MTKVSAQVWAQPLDGGMPFQISVGAEPVTFGRDPEVADVCVRDNRVSKEHAVMQLQPTGSLLLYDCNSRNGTFVDEKKIDIDTAVKITRGMQIEFAPSLGFVILSIVVDGGETPRKRDTVQIAASTAHNQATLYSPSASPTSVPFPDLEDVSYRGDNPPLEDEMSIKRALEIRTGLVSDDAWARHEASEKAHLEARRMFEANLEYLLSAHSGRFVAIQDGRMIIGDDSEELSKKVDTARPFLILPIRRPVEP
jgi:hypothetical protein